METSRNQPCPCGSGKKYKRCCAVRERLVPAHVPNDSLHAGGEVDERVLDSATDGLEGEERGVGMGNAMMRFAEPLVREAGDNPESQQKALTLAMVFWNMALFDDEEGGETFLPILTGADGPCRTEEDRQYMRALAARMVLRHKAMFPGLHRNRVH